MRQNIQEDASKNLCTKCNQPMDMHVAVDDQGWCLLKVVFTKSNDTADKVAEFKKKFRAYINEEVQKDEV